MILIIYMLGLFFYFEKRLNAYTANLNFPAN